MWFLLLQIFIMMLLAAALGAAFMWWWLSRKHEAIADSRERLLEQASRVQNIATRDDIAAHVARLNEAINGHKVDLSPVERDLGSVREAVSSIPRTDLTPVQQRIDAMEARLAAFSLDPVMARVAHVGEAVNQVQPALAERLARLETSLANLKLPEVDLGPVHSGLATLGLSVSALEPKIGELGARIESGRRNDMDSIAARFATLSNALTSLRIPDIAPVQSRLAEIHAAIANIRIPQTDLTPVQQRLGEVHAAISNIPQPNLQPLHASLADLEAFVVALDKPPQDFGPLFNRLSAVDAALASVQGEVREARALKPIDRRLASLEEAIGTMPGPDLSPVIGAVRAIDNRNDLVAVENRLTALEYGLAALHHMLRSRAEGPRDVADNRIAPPLQVVRVPEPAAAPARPEREADPINAFRRADDQANLLVEPAFGQPDDLEAIDGVGPMLRALLHDLGVYYFWQVAEWTPQEIDWVESKLMHFRGRIRRDDWVGHARLLAAAPTAVKRPMQPRSRGVGL